ncbi:nucleotidyltransferase [Robertmurraya sp. FSL R5-0851]|uniref:nucleotidyltransferase n=1 Tax=Robertmurraya sp. FSL R5-0851 TaxID=2921584 RepID=UPI0030FBF802
MKAVGVVVEYNPFHNGHFYHVEQSKILSGADVVIAVMSGPFLQRGEPALLSKWQRAKMALLGGVDIVFELPYAFATQKAEIFARGAIDILAASGCDYVCFGSESGHLEDFYSTLNFINTHQETFDHHIKKNMDEGMSYPRATSSAFQELRPSSQMMDLSKPNNILGFQYIRAIEELNLSLTPLTVARKNADYHDQELSSTHIASATSIRKSIFTNNGQLDELSSYVPNTTYTELVDYKRQFGQFLQWENFWPLLQYRLLTTDQNDLAKIYEVEEGIENRILQLVEKASSFSEFMTLLKTKRYTWTRLQRLCVHILTNTSKEQIRDLSDRASYLCLLGMTDLGRQYLNKWKKHSSLPIVSRLASYKGKEIELDIKAAKTYALGFEKAYRHIALSLDYKSAPMFITKKEE